MSWREFDAPRAFDVICLAHAHDYTPRELDPLFDEIRERFIDEQPFHEATTDYTSTVTASSPSTNQIWAAPTMI